MDSFEFNKVIGAFLGVVFVMFSVSLLSDSIFAAHTPEKPGYLIEVAEEEGAAGGAAAAEAVPIATLLASADAAAGESAFRRCAACHTAENGGANKVGPNLWGIVDRPVASHEGFAYSGAMTQFSEGGSVKWDYEHLNNFLISPKALVPNTSMTFAGLKSDTDRANVIAYLRTLSDSPVPLPTADAAAAPAGEAAPAAAPADGATPPANGATPPAAPAQ